MGPLRYAVEKKLIWQNASITRLDADLVGRGQGKSFAIANCFCFPSEIGKKNHDLRASKWVGIGD